MKDLPSGQLRADAASILFEVLEQGVSLREASPHFLLKYQQKDKALINEIVLGVLRYLPILQFWLNQLLSKPLKANQQLTQKLMLVGLYQLAYTRIPSHAAVGETVEACLLLKMKGLKGLVNGILRNAIRQDLFETQPESEQLRSCQPKWLYRKIVAAYPDKKDALFEALQEKAPIWLRINQQQISLDDYCTQLDEAAYTRSTLHEDGLLLSQSGNITQLPGYADGQFAVQDGAAQMAAQLLDAKAGQRVLDACAAPGGKTCHILERTPQLEQCIALDSDAQRLTRVEENLQRLGLSADIVVGDAGTPETWWEGHKFDRILLDAPCSALGVLRRHPDIKWLRRAADIEQLVTVQEQLLGQLWPLLNEGGILLYATCSILPEENHQQIEKFLQHTPNGKLLPISYAKEGETGWQILPGENNMDGFYYAKIQKVS